MNRFLKHFLPIGLTALLLAGCGFAALTDIDPVVARRAAGGSVIQHDGYVEVTGEIGPGALYSLFCPEDWNGDLVLYAHGYVDPTDPLMLPGQTWNEPITVVFDFLIAQGYAVGYSSYSENGYALKDGITRTRQLKGLFKANFDKPDQTYLIGASLGGLIGVAIAEKHSELVDGVLSICGPVGGSSFQFEHIVHVRALFDVFYPGVIEGDVYTLPPDLVWSDALALQLGQLIGADPANAFLISSINPVYMRWDPLNPLELIESIVTAIGFNIVATRDVLERTHGHIPVGNRDTAYSSPLLGPDETISLNAVVDRFDSTPDAENYIEHWYEPTGALRVPVVTLHTTRDPTVPYSHEGVFEAAVTSAGRQKLLHQIDVPAFGHCNVGVDDFVGAWKALLLLAATAP